MKDPSQAPDPRRVYFVTAYGEVCIGSVDEILSGKAETVLSSGGPGISFSSAMQDIIADMEGLTDEPDECSYIIQIEIR